MKRLAKVILIFGVLIIAVISWALYPTFTNARSEYATVSAIYALKDFVEAEKRWPASEAELYPELDCSCDVFIDYSVSLEVLSNNPSLLKNSVRPVSGEFHTYPHYDERISELGAVIFKLQKSEQDAAHNL